MVVSLALYRKYRPGSLAEVIGQDHVVEPLKRALDNDRVHHAYLFSGPRGCGKTSSARILARSLNCEKGPTSTPCGECDSCVALAPNGSGSLDVIELDAATHGLVDDARDLREKAIYAPANSRYKIYIIDEAHQLSSAAANALLKLIEEPPPHLRFIFATTEPDKIIPTIRSRTHHYSFRLVPARTLQTHLAAICESEGLEADPNALALVARSSGGSVRDSLSILGQLLAGAGDDGLTYADAAAQLGATDGALLDRMVTAMSTNDGAELFAIVDEVVESGHDPRRFVADLLDRFRDLIVVSTVDADAAATLIDGPPERATELREQANQFSPESMSRCADLLSIGLSELKGATAPRLQLELLMARIALPAADAQLTQVIPRLEAVEQALRSGAGTAQAATVPTSAHHQAGPPAAPIPTTPPVAKNAAETATPKAAPAARKAAGVGGGPQRLSDIAPSSAPETSTPDAVGAPDSVPTPTEVDVTPESTTQEPSPDTTPAATPSPTTSSDPALTFDKVDALWPSVLDAIKNESRLTWMMVAKSTPTALNGSTILAAQEDAGTIKRYSGSPQATRVSEIASGVLGSAVTVELAPAGAGSTPKAPASTSPAVATESEPTPQPADEDVTDSVDLEEDSGIDLIARELGAVKITEFEE